MSSDAAPMLSGAEPAAATTGRTGAAIDLSFIALSVAANLLIALALFWPVLTAGAGTVVSLPEGDAATYFVPLRTFGFDHLRATGRPPFWNPHVFAGTPYFANPQTAMLYPPNLLHAFLPAAVAINAFVALHFFLTGVMTSLLARGRGMSVFAAIFAGCAFPLTGGYFMPVYVGHLGILSFCWTPLILLAADRLAGAGSVRWFLIGAAAVAMTFLAGHPQMAYYTALFAGLWFMLNLRRSPDRARAVARFAAMYVLGAGAAAVQLFPTFAASGEYVRAGGLTYEVAASGSLPPVSFLALLAPRALGVWHQSPYVGPYLQWEVNPYCGCAVFLLAAFAMARRVPDRVLLGVLLLVSVVLACGDALPTYRVLYKLVPLFDRFRIPARFKYFVDLFLVLLAARAVDMILADRRARRAAAVAFGCAAVALFAVAAYLAGDAAKSPNGTWASLVQHIGRRPDITVPREAFTLPSVQKMTGAYAARQFGWSGGAAALLAVAAGASLYRPRAALAVAGVALLDVFCVAYTFVVTGPADLPYPSAWQAAVGRAAPPDRVLTQDVNFANRGMRRGACDAYGYDPLVLRRYAEFFALAQHFPAGAVEFMPKVQRPSPLFRMLRVHSILTGDSVPTSVDQDHPLPQVLLVTRAQVLPERDRRFSALTAPAFDPVQTVIFESPPDPAPAPSNDPGTTSVVRQTPDQLEIKATVRSPSILLITDAYAPGWTATPIGSNPAQRAYEVLPADHVLRGIPLAAGEHHLLLRYRPPGLVAGAVVTGLSLAVLVAVPVVPHLRRRRSPVQASA